MRTKFHVLCFFAAMISFSALHAEAADSLAKTSYLANRRTALRCLEAASSYAAQGNWTAALSQSQLGLNYDDKVSDLWYVLALAVNENSGTKAEILSLVEHALDCADWVNYNKDNARVLYADLLSDTGRSADAVEVLDAAPPVFSASAEYIRAKSYYRIGNAAAYANARSKIASACRIFPNDSRFPLLFFKYETPFNKDPAVEQLASYFIGQLGKYKNMSLDDEAELEIHAAQFAHDDELEIILRSFAARSLVHPLYAKLALLTGLISEKEAFEYIASFAENSLNISYIRDFMPLLTEESVIKEANEYFCAFCGTLTSDMSGDGIDDLTVYYYRGRPQRIIFDENKDECIDWEVFCDFGIPVSGKLYKAAALDAGEVDFTWQSFPSLSTFVIKNYDNEKVYSFNIIGDKLIWTPVTIVEDPVITQTSGFSFFFPKLNIDERFITKEELTMASSSYIVPTKERENAFISFSSLNGKMLSADYYTNNVLYAHAQFIDDIPSVRLVDADGDSVFETSEFYAVLSENDKNVYSMETEQKIMENLLGVPSNGADFYLKKIQVDLDKDTIPNFIEEYLPNEGVISSWDSDNDGNWNIRVCVSHDKNSGKTIEQNMFYDIVSKKVITVTCENDIPVSVDGPNGTSPVTKSTNETFYWLGDAGSADIVKSAVEYFDKDNTQGLSVVLGDKENRVQVVHIGNLIFGRVIPSGVFNDEKKNE